jgi:hypothetical protein
MVMRDPDEAAKLMRSLRAMGVRLTIDDFGTGYSSLGYLKRFPINNLKVDRSFVRDLAHSSDDVAITRAVIAMAHSLQMNVIAEGVELREQFDVLLEEGCDEFQGYLCRPPLAERTSSVSSGRRHARVAERARETRHRGLSGAMKETGRRRPARGASRRRAPLPGAALAVPGPSTRTIRLVAGAAPGGSSDYLARMSAEGPGPSSECRSYGEQGGRHGNLAIVHVAKSAPDGTAPWWRAERRHHSFYIARPVRPLDIVPVFNIAGAAALVVPGRCR